MRVKVKQGLSHRTAAGLQPGGSILDVSDAELQSFGDKFEPVPEDDTPAVLPPPTEPILASRQAIALAAELGVDLREVAGSGKDGKVLLRDVVAWQR